MGPSILLKCTFQYGDHFSTIINLNGTMKNSCAIFRKSDFHRICIRFRAHGDSGNLKNHYPTSHRNVLRFKFINRFKAFTHARA